MKRRSYGTIERFLWKDPDFRALTTNAKFLWLYLLTSPRTTICPGLIEASELSVMEDLGWHTQGQDALNYRPGDSVAMGLKIMSDALSLLCETKNDFGVPWLLVDHEQRLMVIPSAVAHNLPPNTSVVKHWLRGLREIPDCEGKRVWVESAYKAIRQAYGTEDPRAKAIKEVHWSNQHKKTGNKNPIDQQVHENNQQNYMVSDTMPEKSKHRVGHGVENNNNNNSNNNSNICNNSGNSDIHNKSNDDRGTLQGTHAVDAPAHHGNFAPCIHDKDGLKIAKPVSKSSVAPDSFTLRQKQMFSAMQVAVFYVPGEGEKTAWEAVGDPVAVAEKLGGPAYPAVDVELIHRLANWTSVNRVKAKKHVDRFLYNRFAASQEHPPRGQGLGTGNSSSQHGDYVHGVDLEEKKKIAKERAEKNERE